MRTEITKFVFNYPTHAVVWNIYCYEFRSKRFEDYVTPDGRALQVYCNYYNTLASAQTYVMEFEEHSIVPVEVWHMYEKSSDEHYATFYDGR